ncbi:META domain-containing protein [Kaistella flava (ex Peng et al. 2021)]|uniref:META domain-containing protein n=1 Tax=Kaistella flava (ex Peng et al. 2021) TaxID=2038776 RepID=A0A7M2Y9Z3_9FLAO|nr:META domain-containing protein [Kaistella flava (ex Peng et al. 2021)]QOW10242.1 META domain-containing protein [Kaistella flava (ex Peng et al. 2021)]
MKKHTLLLIAIISLFVVSCSTNKLVDSSKLYDNAWELEYITGPRIAFQGLFPDEKPAITFNKSTNMVTGTTGCNGYNTEYKMNGKMISFAVPATTTMRYCGEGEAVFLKTMKEVTNYRMTADGQLELLMNDVVMMRFKKVM